MRKPSLIQLLLLSCSIFLFANQSFAIPGKDDGDAETYKAPPRDVRDVLKFIEQSKQNATLEEKAKKVLALSAPSSTDSQVLNSFYYRRAIAYEILGNTKEAAETLSKVVNEYPSRDAAESIEELFTYSQQESLRGNYLGANQTLEKAMAMTGDNTRLAHLTFETISFKLCVRWRL